MLPELLALTMISAPKELGDVAWLRNFDKAQAEAKSSGKPILILFDEVPGCGTCQHYGQAVLSHPLLVEAAETEFVPLAIYNNLGGHDRDILEKYNEPTWNNPVVRVVDQLGNPIAPRLNGDYEKHGLAKTMIAALSKAKRPIPAYLSLLEEELRPDTDRAVFGMYCFWTGEACLGDVDGVVGTRTGYANGREVVEVVFDPNRITRTRLFEIAKQRNCGEIETVASIRSSEKDDKYQLRHTAWAFVPMTDLQASRANSLIGRGRDPSALFSPRQRAIFQAATQRPNAGWNSAVGARDFRNAFLEAAKLSGIELTQDRSKG
jgi:hypothetical protein